MCNWFIRMQLNIGPITERHYIDHDVQKMLPSAWLDTNDHQSIPNDMRRTLHWLNGADKALWWLSNVVWLVFSFVVFGVLGIKCGGSCATSWWAVMNGEQCDWCAVWMVSSVIGEQYEWWAVWLVCSVIGEQYEWCAVWLVSSMNGEQCDWWAVWMVCSMIGEQCDWCAIVCRCIVCSVIDMYCDCGSCDLCEIW